MSAAVPDTVEPALLRWAESCGSKDAQALREKFTHWDSWTSGKDTPSLAQVEKIASFTHIPFGILMLSKPPQIELPIKDFRSGRDNHRRNGDTPASRELLDVIMQMQRRQNWYLDYLSAVGANEPLDFVGSARGASPLNAAANIRNLLGYEVADRASFKTNTDARNYLMRAFEAAGGLVVVSSMVGNNTHRKLDHTEFRGFTLHSKLAPLVFVNSSEESVNAQIFSLLHELAHTWRGESGISLGADASRPDQDPHLMKPLTGTLQTNPEIERWCDLVAAEVVVPEADLRKRFTAGFSNLTSELERLSRIYWCSTLVVLIRLRQIGLIPWEGFAQNYDSELERLKEFEVRNNISGSGGNFYANQRFRIGESLSRAVIRDLRRGRTTPAQALRILNFSSMSMVDKYASLIGES